MITYKEYVIDATDCKIKLPNDIYVHEYKRGDTVMVSIHYFYFNDELMSSKVLRFEVTDGNRSVVTLEQVDGFIGDGISLPVDLTDNKVHPYILQSYVHHRFNGRVWYLIPVAVGNTTETILGSMLSNEIKVMISPIYNIDHHNSGTDVPIPSLNAQATRYHIADNGDYVEIYIKRDGYDVPYSFNIPQIEFGIFKARNMLVEPFDFQRLVPGFKPLRNIEVNIDISSVDNSVADVVTLADLRRGDWVYTQYNIVPIRSPEYALVHVVNSMDEKVIYTAIDDDYVTYVEVFLNPSEGLYFVVVNFTHWDGIMPTQDRKVYMRKVIDSCAIYYDLQQMEIQNYTGFLYNIKMYTPSV
ncbi:spherical body protein, putative [Babesia ovis]|uniref:Spherical body protein, putative n=1 Tax=Babesia ovis TaxID=5869 RepID=A0A9W5TC08_BABOV|nr:spherical body protein, putative [Babesia ovis]